ncbi:MAG: aminotransferase class I/II-fold pyridoxal phosphate-dependent enzyme [Candidatus Zixiibacteriota bacterium]
MIKKVIIEKAERLQKLPPTPFVEAKRIKHGLTRRGVEVIDLGELSPDSSLRDFFAGSIEASSVFAPSDSEVLEKLKSEIRKWLQQRYDLKIRSEKEILPFFGEKRTVYHLLLGLINPSEVVAFPDPGEPTHKIAAVLAGAETETFPLLERNDYLPNLSSLFLSRGLSVLPKIMFLNYPDNPTSSVADSGFFRELVEWSAKRNILVINDVSGNEICYADHIPVALLQTKGARKLAVEIFSFFSLTGVEFGFLVGDRGIISQVKSVQEALGAKVSKASVLMGLEILKNYPRIAQKNNEEFAARKDALMKGLSHLGWKARKPKAGPFVWAKVPGKYSSVGFFRMLLRKTGVLVCPGFGFGEYGEGHIRIALNLPAGQIQKAVERMEKHSHVWQRKYRPKSYKS